jgi:hypothetical protein
MHSQQSEYFSSAEESDSSGSSRSLSFSVVGIPRRPVPVARPAQRRAVRAAGGIAAVVAGLHIGVPRAEQRAPIAPERVAQYAADRYRPPDHDPNRDRLYTFTDSEIPGQEMSEFKASTRRNDPFYMMHCSKNATKYEIGDSILMCIEPTKVNIVIYYTVTTGALKILVKKLKYHTKHKSFARAKLGLFGGRELFTRTVIQKKTVNELTRNLLSLAKQNTITRLILSNSVGGPLSKPWFHTYKSRRHI